MSSPDGTRATRSIQAHIRLAHDRRIPNADSPTYHAQLRRRPPQKGPRSEAPSIKAKPNSTNQKPRNVRIGNQVFPRARLGSPSVLGGDAGSGPNRRNWLPLSSLTTAGLISVSKAEFF